MKKLVIGAASALLAAALLTACGPRNAMSTLSKGDEEDASSLFSLTKVLDLGVNYLVSLDYENAIQQYVEIIRHDPQNKDAYAGLYAAYSALGKKDEAKDVLDKAKQEFGSEGEIMDLLISDADLVMENGGGDSVFRDLSDRYMADLADLDEENSAWVQNIGDAWLAADPSSTEPYAVLSTLYLAKGEEDKVNDLMDKAEENGVAFDNIKTSVEAKSNGSLTLKLDLGKDTAPVEVEVTPQDDAQTVTTKVAEKAADNAASKAVKDSGLTGQAASTANSMAQDALQAGLSALPDMPGVDMGALMGGGN